MPVRRFLLIPVLALTLGLAACGGDDEAEPQTAATTPAPAASEAETPEATQAEEGGDLSDTESRPTIEKPSGEPPSELQTEDIVKGKGKTAKAGDTVSVQYVGASWSTGEEFDASWDRGEPFTFELGSGMVIPGWDEGIQGMKEGGRRRLVIPPDMAYGPAGSPPAIGPNETLIFVVDLLEVQ